MAAAMEKLRSDIGILQERVQQRAEDLRDQSREYRGLRAEVAVLREELVLLRQEVKVFMGKAIVLGVVALAVVPIIAALAVVVLNHIWKV